MIVMCSDGEQMKIGRGPRLNMGEGNDGASELVVGILFRSVKF
jgi:hypothetical protein